MAIPLEPNVIAAIASGVVGAVIRLLDQRSKRNTLETKSAGEARIQLEAELREQIKDLEQRIKDCEAEKRAEVATLRQYLHEWQQKYIKSLEERPK